MATTTRWRASQTTFRDSWDLCAASRSSVFSAESCQTLASSLPRRADSASRERVVPLCPLDTTASTPWKARLMMGKRAARRSCGAGASGAGGLAGSGGGVATRGAAMGAAKMGTASVAAAHDPPNDEDAVADKEGGASPAAGPARAGKRGSLAARTRGAAWTGAAEDNGGGARACVGWQTGEAEKRDGRTGVGGLPDSLST